MSARCALASGGFLSVGFLRTQRIADRRRDGTMAYGSRDYQQDFPPVYFSTFKPPPQDKEEPPSLGTSDTTPRHEAEAKTEAHTDKDKPASSKKTPQKDIMAKPGVKLKEQTYQWFEQTQRKKLVKMGHFPEWFHGFVTRNRAEDMLQDKPLGCFLVRFCESRVGFVLSYRGVERCRHFVLNQQDDEQYVIEGEDSAHPQLEDLINYYSTHPMKPYREQLSTPCSKNPRKPDSPSVSRGSPNSPTSGPAYGRIIKTRETLDVAATSATSPKDKTKQFFNDKLQFELLSSLLGRKFPVFPEPDLTASEEDQEDPVVDYAPFSKPSESHQEDQDEEGSERGPTYASVDELRTYTEPAQWSTPQSDSGHEPIAFYAIGRGSCQDNLENVYSEVDVHSLASGGSKAAKKGQPGFSTLPPAANKPSPAQKTSAFHSSFRANKKSGFPQEHNAVVQGKPAKHASKPKAKQQVPLQFDDPAYGKNTSHHVSSSHPPPALEEQENIYEKIPENYPVKVYLKAKAESKAHHEWNVSQLRNEVRHIQEVMKA